ncbi:hypothetical protein OG689_44265 [Kitasatospora sp. NBC_00240]|uniref:hypothetical protein n=1 Tax=Kitasatospora sp. NBC_00240 TaxID=2903567 RepID=UPI0022511203|nr:hypothetical protein [Kitasatospora sp. NBC_00240]MCX5216153.1 hypothetical protein [Kitasatospora sp. NBC_00240]
MSAAQHTPNTSYDTDLMLRLSRQATSRTVHRRPDEAAPAREPQTTAPAPAQPVSK